MSAALPPEFFFDRSLGKVTATRLRALGWSIHLIAEHYPEDAGQVEDAEWIADGCTRGWSMLTKDKRIRYRASELAALDGHLFCLSAGNLSINEMVSRFERARSAIERAVGDEAGGFWHVYGTGRIKRMDA